MILIVTIEEIANGLKLSRQAIHKRSVKQGWISTGKRESGCKTYVLKNVPLSEAEQEKVKYCLACRLVGMNYIS